MLTRFDLCYRSPTNPQARHWLLMQVRAQFIMISTQQDTMNQRDGSSLLGTSPHIDLLFLPASFEFQQCSAVRPGQYSFKRPVYRISYRFCAKYDSHWWP